ncbi:MAG: protein kinase [Ponticaulis sp.]|nr:protein kinase [Ponticaulis sp.]
MASLDDLNSGKLAGQKHVRLNEGLTEFPKALFELADTLEVLDLNSNELSSLPDDFGRFKKLRILFLSNNPFTVLPEVLSDCPALSMVGFKNNKISQVPENSLPDQLRWLILTDNEITALPQSIGRLNKLQKCMLAGNQLTDLPEEMANCRSIELLRLSANHFEAIPDFVFDLPKLTWLTFAGNPLHQAFENQLDLPSISFGDLTLEDVLGEGASGVISRAIWSSPPSDLAEEQGEVAVKVFKSDVTSDGYPQDEMKACLAAGRHPNLVHQLARVTDAARSGLVMRLIGAEYRNLGLPPTFETCTRDVFASDLVLSAEQALHIARQMTDVLQHLRAHQICHGDLYAHNTLINADSHVLFGDFGGAANYASLPQDQAERLERVEVRALACLFEDLVSLVPIPDREAPQIKSLIELIQDCMSTPVTARPDVRTIRARLG